MTFCINSKLARNNILVISRTVNKLVAPCTLILLSGPSPWDMWKVPVVLYYLIEIMISFMITYVIIASILVVSLMMNKLLVT